MIFLHLERNLRGYIAGVNKSTFKYPVIPGIIIFGHNILPIGKKLERQQRVRTTETSGRGVKLDSNALSFSQKKYNLKGNRRRGPQGFDHTKAETSARGKESGKGEVIVISSNLKCNGQFGSQELDYHH